MHDKAIARVAVSAAVYAIDKPYDYEIPVNLADRVQVGCRVLVGFGRGDRKAEALVLSLCESSDAPAIKPVLQVLDEAPVLDPEGIRLALWLRDRCFCTFYDVLKTMLPAGIWYQIEHVYTVSKRAEQDRAEELVADLENGGQVVNYLFRAKGRITEEKIRQDLGLDKIDKILRRLLDGGILNLQSSARRGMTDKTVRLARLACSAEEIDQYMQGRRVSLGQRSVLRLLREIGCCAVREISYFTGASQSVFHTLAKHGLIEFTEQEVFRRPEIKAGEKPEKIQLNPAQERAYCTLQEMQNGNPACALLYGVTGSGKTLVYMKLIEHTLSQGKTALMLVPEIALTPQLVERFAAYFGDRIAILHSALAAGERLDEWKRIRSGAVRVVIGTRSAVFAPLRNLGVVILDEEQEHTYKSGNTPRYHARDVAKFRCVADRALLLLGSATPSVETMYQAQSGRYALCTLEERFNARAMPRVVISDMREALRAGNTGSIGVELCEELRKNLERGEQSILFLNRRGASRYAICEDCGEVPGCPNCSAALTYHSANRRLMCHHCGYSSPAIKRCACGGAMRFVGAGTQRVEEELIELFPGIPILRMDTDTTSAKAAHQTLLERFRDERIPIMIGTQMITKGLDFENVTLVGVLAADQALYVDDYHAAENTFALITQVVGRAGRGEKEGRAVLQTYSPQNPVIALAAQQDYAGFYQSEIELRQARGFPPFRDLIAITVSGVTEDEALKGCLRLMGKLAYAREHAYSGLDLQIYGPAPAAVTKLNNRYRYKIQISGVFDRTLRQLIASLIRDFKLDRQYRNVQITADVNPVDS